MNRSNFFEAVVQQKGFPQKKFVWYWFQKAAPHEVVGYFEMHEENNRNLEPQVRKLELISFW